MRLFKDKVTEKLWVEMCEGGNLIDFDGCSYSGDVGRLVEVNTNPIRKEFCRQHIIGEKFDITVGQDWHLKDILLVPIEGKNVAFRVEHISEDKVYFVAVDAVGKSTMLDMNEYLDDYLKKMPKALVNQMCEMEHIVDDNVIRKSKLILLSGKNVSSKEEHDYTGADDIEFDGLKTGAERCKNFNGETAYYWLDTLWGRSALADYSVYFMYVSIDGNLHYKLHHYYDATGAIAVVPCFSIARKPEADC
jgi:hypothetical protein